MDMKSPTFPGDDRLGNNLSTVSKVKQGSNRQRSPLEWWYRFTAPPQAPASASLERRELARLGRLTSAILLVVILLVLAAVPVAISGPNHVLLFILLIPLTIDGTALVLNRLGKIKLAGIVVVIGIEVGIGLSIIGPPGGLTTYSLAQFDLLVQAEFVAVSLLPRRSVFLVASIHSVFIWACITFLPHTAEFARALAVNGYDVYLRPITLQIIVAVVTYLWVTSAQEAIARADRAEEIAELEQREIERQQREIEEKRQLDSGIQQILQTHVQVANGDFRARAPLTQDNVLWRIAYSLNNLLARLQRLSQAEYALQRVQAENESLIEALRNTTRAEHELQQTRDAVIQLVEAVQHAKQAQVPLRIARSGTIVDALVQELGPSNQGFPGRKLHSH